MADVLADSVASRRATIVTGPRQAGKTTLARQLLDEQQRGTLRRLDDDSVLQAAQDDPAGFVAAGERPIVIDEVQRAGDPLVRAIKLRLDDDDRPGQYVLTGSSNFLTVPTISESLAGRASFIELWPFTQGEIGSRPETFVDRLFTDAEALREPLTDPLGTRDYLERLCVGGYPEVQHLPARQRSRWFRDYVRTTVQRDVVELSGIRKVAELHDLLRLLAARSGNELAMTGLIDDSRLGRQAVYDHYAWLRTIHLVAEIPAWSRNISRRVKRRPKTYVTDSGLAAWLVGKNAAALAEPTEPATGPLVETFVATELMRQLTWAAEEITMYHWRDRDGAEIDLVLEASDGRVAAIEVKKGATVTAKSFRWLRQLRDRLDSVGGAFVHGAVLYTGRDVLPFGDRLTALPIASLWSR